MFLTGAGEASVMPSRATIRSVLCSNMTGLTSSVTAVLPRKMQVVPVRRLTTSWCHSIGLVDPSLCRYSVGKDTKAGRGAQFRLWFPVRLGIRGGQSR